MTCSSDYVEIELDPVGARPDWLEDDDQLDVRWGADFWYGDQTWWRCVSSPHKVTAIRIPRDSPAHARYLASKKPEAPALPVTGCFLQQLRKVNGERAKAWMTNPLMLCEHCGATEGDECAPPFKRQPHSFTKPHPYLTEETPSDPLFWAIELGGEVGEILNVVKKLRREELGWRGSRSTPDDLADEIADGLICLDSLARHYGINLAQATAAKFNKTSEKVGLPHRLAALNPPEVDPLLVEAREIVAQRHQNGRDHDFAKWVRDGDKDSSPDVLMALAALRRGMELATITQADAGGVK